MKILMSSIFVLFFLGATEAHADQSHAGLTAEINGLKVHVKYLEERIAKLELRTSTPPSVKGQKLDATGNPWRQLTKRMTKEEVIGLLGQPGKIHAVTFAEFWYYPDIYGGKVRFDDSGRLQAWNEP